MIAPLPADLAYLRHKFPSRSPKEISSTWEHTARDLLRDVDAHYLCGNIPAPLYAAVFLRCVGSFEKRKHHRATAICGAHQLLDQFLSAV